MKKYMIPPIYKLCFPGYHESKSVKKQITLKDKGGSDMLWTIFVILMILWLLGFVSGYTIGGFIHILLVIAIVVVLIRIIQGRRPL